MTKEVTKFDKNSRRLRERIRLALPARVQGWENRERPWAEMTRLIDVTPFGARFRLSRPTEPGRLLQLTLAMPRKLRVFDHTEDQYRVWCLVRNARLLDPKKDGPALLEVGAAFIGKRPPQSYKEDPNRRYEIAQTKLEAELWNAQENIPGQLSEVTSDEKRKESRQLIPVEVVVEVLDQGKVVARENTVTENISRKGALVFTSLEATPGTFVKMSSVRQNAVVLAVVRARRDGADGIPRLHLEFVAGEWPL